MCFVHIEYHSILFTLLETPEGNETDDVTEENITTSVPTQCPYVVTDDAYSKSAYLESRVSLYANLIKRPEGQEKKQAIDVRPSVRDMIADFTLYACKGMATDIIFAIFFKF